MHKRDKIIVASVALLGVLALTAVYATISALFNPPDFQALRNKIPMTIKTAAGSETTREFGPATPNWVPLSEISQLLVRAVLAQEDTSFFLHKGVDYHELKEAIKHDIREKSYARGASTITQQVVKNAFLSQQKTLWRKIREFFWAKEIEKHLSKNEILAFYLNMAEWGPGIYGIGAASRYYFAIPPSELNAKQGAFLAMLLPSPRRYHDRYFVRKEVTDWAAKRIARTLHVMHKMKFIDDFTYRDALTTSLFGEGAIAPDEDDAVAVGDGPAEESGEIEITAGAPGAPTNGGPDADPGTPTAIPEADAEPSEPAPQEPGDAAAPERDDIGADAPAEPPAEVGSEPLGSENTGI